MITCFLRKPKFPLICDVHGVLIAGATPKQFEAQAAAIRLPAAEQLPLVDASGEGWVFCTDGMMISPLTHKKRWTKKEIIATFNSSDTSRQLGRQYSTKSMSAKRLDRIVTEIVALIASASKRGHTDLAPPGARTRLRQASDPQRLPEENMSRYKFSVSLPRKMHWSDEVGGYASCPDCGGPLESEHHAYVLATRRNSEVNIHVAGNTAGYFCGKCPLVVLDREEFAEFAALAEPTTDGIKYCVMGIVDLDAVPEDKRGLPFDEDTNPLPLVLFSNIGREKSAASKSGTKCTNRRKRKKRKKKKR